jgi:hypothetical protein
MWKLLRDVFVFVVAVALLLAGLYLLAAEMFLAHRIFLRLVIAGIMLTSMGGYLLWTDFIAPRFAIKRGG